MHNRTRAPRWGRVPGHTSPRHCLNEERGQYFFKLNPLTTCDDDNEQPSPSRELPEQSTAPSQVSEQPADEDETKKTESGCDKSNAGVLDQNSIVNELIQNISSRTKSLSFSLDDNDKCGEIETKRGSVDFSLTPEMIERKQQSAKAQKNFSEALRENKHRREVRKKKINVDENSIVSRILGEKRKSETKEPIMADNNKDVKVPQGSRREKTISVCSDNIPDLCPIEGDDTPEADFLDEGDKDFTERHSDEEVHDEELTCNLSKKNIYKSGSLFFMTDFDDEEDIETSKSVASEDESFADAAEHLSHDETVKIIPLIKEVLTSTLKEGFCDNQSNDVNIDRISANLLSPLTTLVKNIVDEKLTSSSSKGPSPLCTPDVKSGNQCLVSVSEKEIEVSTLEGDYDGDNDVDAFDESMKRLEFIESSFKTIISDEAVSIPAIQHSQDQNQVENRLERIKMIMASSLDQAEKLLQIDSILKEDAAVEMKD